MRSPAFSVGGNLDLNLYPNLAFRIAPSYLGTTFGGTCRTTSASRWASSTASAGRSRADSLLL